MRVVCSACEHEVPRGRQGSCPHCGDILRPAYPDHAVRRLASQAIGRGLDRYRFLLPTDQPIPDGGVGDTPLVRSRRLGPGWGLERLYFKLEGCNPSGSFKDRPASLAVALALEAGAGGMLTASSGNAGAALAAQAAAAGLACLILLEPGNPPNKTRQMLAHGARVIPVEGIFHQPPHEIAAFLTDLADQLGYYLSFVWAPVNPYLLEGIKSISYEICHELGGAPDSVVAPVGGGDMLTAQWRGYHELHRAGLAPDLPQMLAVQSTAAGPLLVAYEQGLDRVPRLDDAVSRISGINVAFSGDHGLRAVLDSGGRVVGVDDEVIFGMQTRLAREEGLWVEPAGAAPVAAVASLVSAGLVGAEERIVCVLSGAGFKDSGLGSEAADKVAESPPIAFEVEAVIEAARRPPRMGAVDG